MDPTRSEERRDATSRKKYNLTLKRSKPKIQEPPLDPPTKDVKMYSTIAPKNRNNSSDFGDSQNIMLRLSDSFSADDTFERVTSAHAERATMAKKSVDQDIIVISDSSDGSSPDRFNWMRSKSSEVSRVGGEKATTRERSVYWIKSSDSEDNDRENQRDSRDSVSKTEKLSVGKPQQRCSILYTSDDFNSENDSRNSLNNRENAENLPFTPEAQKLTENVDKSLPKADKLRGILTENRCNIETPESTKSHKVITGKIGEAKRTPISAISSRTTTLTKKDTRKILKAIKSTRLVPDSPREWTKSDSDSDASSPVARYKNNDNFGRNNGIVIAETDSDSDDKVILGSRVDPTKPYKTHLSRFLEPAINDETNTSEKKKLEVAHWLMSNSRDSRSDSSVSNVSASQRNSPNSGNSSLDRLEMNYETPNNRGKLRTPNTGARLYGTSTSAKINGGSTSAKSNVAFTPLKAYGGPTPAKPVSSTRQKTIDDFLKKSKDGKRIFTPISTAVTRRSDLISPAVREATDKLGLMDCADILDNLYGETWRATANDLIPTTEPRKAIVPRMDKGVQTERKAKSKMQTIVGKLSSSSSSRDDDFDEFMKDIRPNLNSTKKPVDKPNRRRCSFIKDSSSSENDAESTYMTALTNPRISDIRKISKKQTPASTALQRIRAICDSDSDDEIVKAPKSNKPTIYRKKLSYSDDESDSNTSEYDPSDILPPKSTTKPAETSKAPKISAKLPRAAPSFAQQRKIDKTKTFLESLAATVPLNEAHPNAKKYRQSFKNTKEELCQYLYKLYNDKIFDNKLPSDMSIEWNVRMRGTAGFCYNKRSVKALGGVTRSSRIVLATKILDTPDRLRDTLVHEMCHAAAWLINEVSDGHGPFWKGWASRAMKAFPELPPIRRCHDYEIKTKFTYRCVGCGYSIGRHSKSLDVEKKRCGHCYGKFELLINKVTKAGTVEAKTPTTKKPSAFALFVKDNYGTVKKERKGVAHKEVMQILGQQFSAFKISKKNGNSDDNNSDGVSNVR